MNHSFRQFLNNVDDRMPSDGSGGGRPSDGSGGGRGRTPSDGSGGGRTPSDGSGGGR